ncbi:THUMP domain-containing class I SAM-dependent RNA methyltransferase [Thiobacter aerophilum]|uniref:THUMP domain-containing protein n=1 Tax=Thiobacter aerophilum TaxID=3121275 RepID=A0ABV0EJD6_9BURK
MSEHFFAPCPRGLESALAAELTRLGAAQVSPVESGVGFQGDWPLCYRVNLWSRLASRVLWRIAHGPYQSEEEVYRLARAVDWPSYFDVDQTFAVSTVARRCPLKSLNFVTLRIKDAVCDRFRDTRGRRPNVDTARPAVRLAAFLDATHLTLYLDTSGEALFKRGWRKSKGEAPLKENLAAGILHLTGWQPGVPLLDPMCGSGTFLMEAALMALHIAPGLGRGFAFERLENFDAQAWARLRREAEAECRPRQQLPLWGSDSDAAAVRHARRNFAEAGLAPVVALERKDVLELEAPAAEGVLVTNPPYGERIGDLATLAEFYPRLGSVLKQRFAGWRVFIFTADTRLPGLMRLKPARRTPLYNGPLACRLYEFPMVAGSHRRQR